MSAVPPVVVRSRPLQSGALLVWADTDLAVTEGSVLIGRNDDCDIIFSDPLVSRRHARIIVSSEDVLVEDLLSANGVYVNGVRVDRLQELHDGDRVLIGTREISVFDPQRSGSQASPPPKPATAPSRPRLDPLTPRVPTPTPIITSTAPPNAIPSGPTQKAVPFLLLGKMVDKFIAAGRVADAERVIHDHMMRVLDGARAALVVPQEVCDSAGEQAMKLAQASRNGRWVNYAVELHMRAHRVMSEAVTQGLFSALLSVPSIDVRLFRHYIQLLRGMAPGLTRVELERVNRLAAAKLPGGSVAPR
jgi:pSer/pThr/pTyr-binding forkhead associated (FHA) protein